jgi:hypothetical protein
MFRELILATVAVTAVPNDGRAAAGINIAAEIHPAKNTYSQFEPVELAVNVTNTSDATVEVAVQYPHLEGIGHAGIQIWSGDKPAASAAPADREAFGEVRTPLIPLGPSDVLSASISSDSCRICPQAQMSFTIRSTFYADYRTGVAIAGS